MKFLLFCLSLLPIAAHAWGEVDGYLEARKYFNANYPGHFDATGDPQLYGVDFQFNFRLVPKYFTLIAGARSNGNAHGFSQAAGRAGIETHWKMPFGGPRIDVGVMHESQHNFEYEQGLNVPYRFYTGEWLYVRYNFGNKP